MKCVIHKYSMLYIIYDKRDPGWCSIGTYFDFNQQDLPIFVIRRHSYGLPIDQRFEPTLYKDDQGKTIDQRGLPLNTYAPRRRGGGASYTFILRITCKRGEGVCIAGKLAYVLNGRSQSNKNE